MTGRTTETTVTFQRSFNLAALDERQPAGAYRVTIDEEEILGVSVLAFRRTATMLHTPAIAVTTGPRRMFRVERADLDAALTLDRIKAAEPAA